MKRSQQGAVARRSKPSSESGKAGRPEVLTEALARKISRMIETMPDLEMEVNWINVKDQVKRKYGHDIGIRAMSQKAWSGEKILADAFDKAKGVERTLKNEGGKRYATTSRQNLVRRIEVLEAQLQEAKREIDAVRAVKYDSLDRLRITTSDLRKLVDGPESNS